MKSISIGLIFFSLFSFSALADSLPAHPMDKTKADLRINAGWAIGFGPEFFGSAQNEFKHRPMVDLRYKGRFQIFGPKMRYSLFKKSNFSIGPQVSYSFGRKESDNPMLEGLGDNANRLEFGAFLHYKKKDFEIRFEGKGGLGENIGETLMLTVVKGLYRSEDIALLMVLRSQWYSQSEMQRQFGVTQQQSAASIANLSAFRTASGISNGSLILLGEYKLKQNVSLLFIGAHWQLMSDAKNSPLIKSDFGKDFQSLFGTALVYKF